MIASPQIIELAKQRGSVVGHNVADALTRNSASSHMSTPTFTQGSVTAHDLRIVQENCWLLKTWSIEAKQELWDWEGDEFGIVLNGGQGYGLVATQHVSTEVELISRDETPGMTRH